MKLELTRHDLKILSICYYIQAGIIGFYSLICLAYSAFLGVVFSMIPAGNGREAIPEGAKAFLSGLMVALAIFTIVVAVITVLCGRYLPRGTNRTFCYVVAGLTCLAIPYGTTLGVFTFLVLNRPEAKQIATGIRSPLSTEPPMLPVG